MFLVDLGYVFTERDYKDWEKELFGVRIRREQSIDQRRRNLAEGSLETRLFVNFGAYSEWWKIKCFISEWFSFYDQTEQSYNLIKIRIQGKFHSSSVALNVVHPDSVSFLFLAPSPAFPQASVYVTKVWNVKHKQNQSFALNPSIIIPNCWVFTPPPR